MFRETLKKLSLVAEHLPQDECNYEPFDSNSDSLTFENAGETQAKNRSNIPGRNLIKMWNSMQKVICGSKKEISENAFVAQKPNEQMNMEAFGLSNKQSRNLKLLFHVFMSNPRILYAPANTSADQIIKKVPKLMQNFFLGKILNFFC